MSSTSLHQVWGKCTLQYNNTVDSISVVCSILFWNVKQIIMHGIWNAMHMIMACGKAIMYSS